MLPSTLKVLLLDITQRTLVENNPMEVPSFPNITALSISQYFRKIIDEKYLPPIDNQTFPNLRYLNQPSTKFNLSIIDLRKAGLAHLEYIDFSSSEDKVTDYRCKPGLIHPWFLSTDAHITPQSSDNIRTSSYDNDAFQLPPRLNTMIARDISQFYILNVIQTMHTEKPCKYAPNSLSTLDISENVFYDVQGKLSNCKHGMKGLNAMRTLIAQELEAGSDFTKYLLESLPQLTSMDLTQSKGFDLNVLDKPHNNLKILIMDELSETEISFPNNALHMDLKDMLPSLQNLTVTGNKLKFLNITIPNNLTLLDMQNNDIAVIANNPKILSDLSAHAKSYSDFIVDFRGNDITCECECSSPSYNFSKWLVESAKFVRFDEVDGCGNYSGIKDCVTRKGEEGSCVTSVEETGMPYFAIGIIIALVFVAALGVSGFFVWRNYEFKIRAKIMSCLNRGSSRQTHSQSNSFYLIFGEQEWYQQLAAYVSEFAPGFNLDIKSRMDILAGEMTNQRITDFISDEIETVIVMIPDRSFIGTEAYYNELLTIALHFRHKQIYPVSTDETSYDDILSWVEEYDCEHRGVFEIFRPNFKTFLPSSSDMADTESCARGFLKMVRKTFMLDDDATDSVANESNIALVEQQ